MFGDAVEFVEAHPECVNNRAGGPTGCTLLHQMAWWRLEGGLLRRLKEAGAVHDLVAQMESQVQSGQPDCTPLEVTGDGDTLQNRAQWRRAFCDIFELAQPGDPQSTPAALSTALGLPPQGPAPQPVAAAGGAGAAVGGDGEEWRCLVSSITKNPSIREFLGIADDLVLTASSPHQGARCVKTTATRAILLPSRRACKCFVLRADCAKIKHVCVCSLTMQSRLSVGHEGHALQQWRLTEHGHLQCQAGGFCIDIDGKNPDEGAKVIMWTMKLPNPAYPEATNQMWVYGGRGPCFVSKMEGKYGDFKVLSIAGSDLFGGDKPKNAGAGMGLEMSENMCEGDDGSASGDMRMAMGPVANKMRQVWAFE
jgi:hypothetical protein